MALHTRLEHLLPADCDIIWLYTQFGFWELPDAQVYSVQDYDGKVCLQNLTNKTWHDTTSKQRPVFLKLLPLESPVPEVPESDVMRVRRVTVVHWDGAKAATTIGIKVEESAKVTAYITAIKAALGPLMDPDIDIMFGSSALICDRDITMYVHPEQVRLTDACAGRMRFWAFRVPKAAPQQEAKDVKMVMQPGGYLGPPPKVPQYVLIMHERKRVAAAQHGRAGCSGAGGGSRHTCGSGYGPRWERYNPSNSHSEYEAEDSYDSDDEDVGYLSYTGPQTERWGTPILLPLPILCASGGKAATAYLKKALAKALKPYISGCSPSLTSHITLMRGSALYCDPFSPSARRHNNLENVPGAHAQLNCAHNTHGKDVPGVATVYCWWAAPAAGAAWPIGVARFNAPVVDASASDAVMAENKKLIQEADARAKRMQMLVEMPGQVLEELVSVCRLSPIVKDLKRPLAGRSCVPMAATVLDLEPSTDKRRPRIGTLLVDVYLWKKPGQNHRHLFTDCSTWDDPHTTGPRGFNTNGQGPCPMRQTLNAFAMRTPEGYKALQEYRALSARSEEARSLNSVMEVAAAGEREAAEQPDGLTVNLHPYQLQSLKFMQDVEKAAGGYRGMFWHAIPTSSGGKVWWSQVFDRVTTHVPEMPWGGFLAEEMGLGKTVEVLGLILSNPAPASVVSGCTTEDNELVVTRATLVVCAVSLVGQWMTEARSKLSGNLRIHMYHGSGRIREPHMLASNYDLVVTTYATLGSDLKRDAKPPLGQIRWHRVVFDEGHAVKNPKVAASKACIALHSERRWCCTGTPINNSIEDLFGQFCVLHMAPLFNQPWFNAVVKPAFGIRHHYNSSTVPLLYVLSKTLIRHTKQQVIVGEEVLKLPKKTEEVVAVTLSAEEQRVYLETHKKAARLFAECKKLNNTWINQHLLSIMALLLPLRRICSGGMLSPKDLADAMSGAVPSAAGLVVPADVECSICLDAFERPVMTPCGHWFCTECIKSCLSANGMCPLCRQGVDQAALRAAQAPTSQASSDDEDMDAGGPAGALCDSKLKALVAELKAMREADSTSKALIFSQYTCTLEWLQQKLPDEGFGFRTITGSMPLKQRAKAIEAFQQDPPTTVFLLSMRSGAVGINLTAASHVFILEPCLNPALEEQAIGRAWRMGQQREVVVKRFCVKGSVEARIMEVRKKRQELAGSDPSHAAELEAPVRGASKKQAAAVLAGNLRSDRQNLKVSELDVLFQEPRLTVAGDASGSGGGDTGAGPSNRA